MSPHADGLISLSLRISTPLDTADLSRRLGLKSKRVRSPGRDGLNYWCGEMEDQREVHSIHLCDLLSEWIQELESKADVLDETLRRGGRVTLVLALFVERNVGFQFAPDEISALANLQVGFICEVYPPRDEVNSSVASTR